MNTPAQRMIQANEQIAAATRDWIAEASLEQLRRFTETASHYAERPSLAIPLFERRPEFLQMLFRLATVKLLELVEMKERDT